MDRSWETLHPDLLELILDRLTVPDYLRFSAVCRQWHRVQTEHRLRGCHRPSAVQMPWLMLPGEYQSPQSRLFYSLSEQRSYRLPIPPLGSQKHLCDTSHGWLLLLSFLYHEHDTNFLLLKDLVTGSEIQLPALPPMRKEVSGGALSSSPTDPDCVVLVWYANCTKYHYCRIRDMKWITSPDLTYTLYDRPAICGGKIYMGVRESMLIEVEPCPIPVERCLEMVSLPVSAVGPELLVESDGELLLARYITNRDSGINMFKIFKADLSRKVWVRMESLGDRVLFLSHGKSFSIRAVDAASPKNRIYFTSWLSFLTGGTTPAPLWIEYDYENHQVINGKFPSAMGNGQENFHTEFMHWLVPSLH